MSIVIWLGIVVCIVHSGMFSGLNLAFFSIGRMELEVEARNSSSTAKSLSH